MSIRPRYGSNGVRRASAYDQSAEEENGWFSWRDMRPVLLKSAGIVGLAGAIMAVVSSNALFVDPGGPDRPSQHAASEDRSEPAPVVIVATTSAATDVAATEITPAEIAPAEIAPAGAPSWQNAPTEAAPAEAETTKETVPLQTASTAAVVLPPAESVQPETTASVIPAEPMPARPVPPPQAAEPAPGPPELPAAASTPSAPPDAVAQSAASRPQHRTRHPSARRRMRRQVLPKRLQETLRQTNRAARCRRSGRRIPSSARATGW